MPFYSSIFKVNDHCNLLQVSKHLANKEGISNFISKNKNSNKINYFSNVEKKTLAEMTIPSNKSSTQLSETFF